MCLSGQWIIVTVTLKMGELRFGGRGTFIGAKFSPSVWGGGGLGCGGSLGKFGNKRPICAISQVLRAL